MAFLVASLALSTSIAVAQGRASDIRQCIGEPEKEHEAAIEACSLLLQSPQALPTELLAAVREARGLAYSMAMQYDEALADLDAAISLKPGFARIYRYRGLAYMGKHDYQSAIADFDIAVRLNPGSADILYNRAMAHSNNCDITAAASDIDRADQLAPSSPSIVFMRASILERLGRREEAIVQYGRVIDWKPPVVYHLALCMRGRMYLAQKDHDRALADLDVAIKEFPRSGYAYELRGQVRESRGDSAGALQDYERAIELNAGSRELSERRDVLKKRMRLR